MNTLIETCNRLGGQFLHFAWPMLWQSSLLIAVVLAADLALARRLRASVRHALWLVVLVKLLLPPTLALPTGAAWWLFPAAPVPPPAVRDYAVTYDQNLPPAASTSLPPLPPVTPPPPSLSGPACTLLVGAAGSALLLAWLLVRWWQLSQKVRAAAPLEAGTGALHDARHRTGLPEGIRVKLVTDTLSPAVCGLFRPVILLPRTLVEKLPAAQLRAVLLHEIFHLRRKDIWVNCAQALLQILYWWHPLVWLANARIRRVREEAVDDAVMLALADEAEAYALTLLEVARLAFQRPLLSLGLVGIMESRSALRQRIERLTNFRAPHRAGLTLVSFGGIFLFSAVALPMGQGPAPADRATPAIPTLPATPAAARQTNPPSILIEAAFYQLPANRLDPLVAGLPAAHGYLNDNTWYTASPEAFTSLQDGLKHLGFVPFQRPRVLTSSGNQATFYVGDGTNGLRLDCLPVLHGQNVNLTVQGQLTDPGQTGIRTNQFHATATPVNAGGIALRLKSIDGQTGSNVVAIIGVRIITNSPAKPRQIAAAAKQAQAVPVQASNLLAAAASPDSGDSPSPVSAELMSAAPAAAPTSLGSGSSHEALAARVHRIQIPDVSFKQLPLTEALRELAGLAKQADPGKKGVNFLMNSQYGDLSHVTLQNLSLTNAPLAEVLDAMVLVADHPIKYTVQDFAVVFTARGSMDDTPLLRRGFRVNSSFTANFKLPDGLPLDSGTQETFFFNKLGINPTNPTGKTVVFNDRSGNLIFPAVKMNLSKTISFNDQSGDLFVTATRGDLDIVKRAIEASNRLASAAGPMINPATGLLISANASDTLPDALAATNRTATAGTANLITRTYRLGPPRSEAEVKQLLLDAGVRMPPATFLFSQNGYLVVRGTLEQQDLVEQTIRQQNGVPPLESKASQPVASQNTNTAATNADSTQLFSRTFKIDPNRFTSYFQAHGISDTNHISRAFILLFSQLGLDLNPALGKSIFFGEAKGYLFVKATESDLDVIERTVQAFNQQPLQLHLKARFYQGPKEVLDLLDKSLLATNTVSGQRIGFLSEKDKEAILHKWAASKKSVEALGEPEVTVLSGRHVQMRATQVQTIITNLAFLNSFTNENGSVTSNAIEPQTCTVEFGPILEAITYVLADDYTINLTTTARDTEFFGYAQVPKRLATHSVTNAAGEVIPVANPWPAIQTCQQSATVNLWDNQTLVLWPGAGQPYRPGEANPARDAAVAKHIQAAKKKNQADEVIVLITTTIVDPAGNRIHSDEKLPFAATAIPPQPSRDGK